MKASDFIIEKIIESGTDKIFGYIGGMITHVADSIYQNPKAEMINAIHEQGAGFMAEGYARETGKIGVAIATSGPGATNLLTSIANCFFDSTPVLFITGQVNTFEYKKYPKIRQCGFQETNIVDIVKPIVKYAKRVTKPEDLRYELEKCLYLVQNGRKAPVLLDLPMDIQKADLDFSKMKSFTPPIEIFDKYNICKVIELIKKAKTPIVLAGGGVRLANAQNELSEFIEKTHLPVVQSLMGLDAIASEYKYNLGLIGSYANRYANIAISNADLILVLGSRLDIRQTGSDLNIFSSKKIIQVDIDKNELDCGTFKKIKIRSDILVFLKRLNAKTFTLNIENWQNSLLELKNKYPSTKSIDGTDLLPNKVTKKIFENLNSEDVVTVDVGQNQMWSAQSAIISGNNRIFFSGGLGAMGFALPCGIGAAISGKRVVVISGDGGIQMNIQELEVIKRRNLPVKIIILNNKSLGMVRQFQEMYFENRLQSTVEDYSVPDFERIAKSYGINAYTKEATEIDDEFLKDFFENNKAGLLNILFDNKSDLQPKVLFGESIENMHPYISKEEFKENIIQLNA